MRARWNVSGPSRRVAAWAGVGLLTAWLLVQNAILLAVAATRLDWHAPVTTLSGLWKIAVVLLQTLGPALFIGALVAVGLALLMFVAMGDHRVQGERHA